MAKSNMDQDILKVLLTEEDQGARGGAGQPAL